MILHSVSLLGIPRAVRAMACCTAITLSRAVFYNRCTVSGQSAAALSVGQQEKKNCANGYILTRWYQ